MDQEKPGQHRYALPFAPEQLHNVSLIKIVPRRRACQGGSRPSHTEDCQSGNGHRCYREAVAQAAQTFDSSILRQIWEAKPIGDGNRLENG